MLGAGDVNIGSVRRHRDLGGTGPLLLLACAVGAVAAGLGRGVWIENLHNGLLGPSFAGVGVYVLYQRPRNRCGWVFLATGVVEATMFLGRQLGHDPQPGTSPWWGWLGACLLPVSVALVTLSVILFPDGRAPSRVWRWVIGLGAGVTGSVTLVAALWPVGQVDAGVNTPPPFTAPGTGPSEAAWSAVAHTTFALFQLIWLLAVVDRWRRSGPTVRRQLAFVSVSVLGSLLALVGGLVGWGTPVPGLLTACLVPVMAGWAIVHVQNLATYAALGWMAGDRQEHDLPAALATAIAGTLEASSVTVWAKRTGRVHPIAASPGSPTQLEPCDDLDDLDHLGLVAERQATRALPTTVQPIAGADDPQGAIVVQRDEPLSRHERKLLEGFSAQAALVLDRRTFGPGSARTPTVALDQLTPRENDVLRLMAQGMTNAAIRQELHLSIKTIEPVVSSIFAKLELPPGSESNRRVLAVLAYVEASRRAGTDESGGPRGSGLADHPSTA